MKKIAIIFILTVIFFACNENTNKEATNDKLILAENIQSILPLEKDTVWSGSDLTNALNGFDREKLFSTITNAVVSGQLKAYANYPGTPFTIAEFNNILVEWDSTNEIEDPNNPGFMISAPLKTELTAYLVPQIKFHETIEMDTVRGTISEKISFISFYTYEIDSKGYLGGGIKKIFDVKLNDK